MFNEDDIEDPNDVNWEEEERECAQEEDNEVNWEEEEMRAMEDDIPEEEFLKYQQGVNWEEEERECAQEEDNEVNWEEEGTWEAQPHSSSKQCAQPGQQCDEARESAAFNLNSLQDALEGFGPGNMSDIVSELKNLAGGGDEAGLSNLIASGGLAAAASSLISSASHHFFGINPETGRIIGAIAGNLIFNLGGKHNSLGDIGKLILDNILSGKFKRKIKPFVSPTPNARSFNLNFYQERDRCLQSKALFVDPEFPAQDYPSLYYAKRPTKNIEWKRPGEIVEDPQLIVGGESRFDVVQGALGDCWLLAATANLTLREELFYRVVPPDQSFTENYAGIFHFQFWRYGAWVDVVIDDRLPTENGRLIYMHSADNNEFWSALLEKAYAKLYGSYEALKGGSTAEALEDFTGGLVEYYDLRETSKEQILALLIRGFQMGSMFGCSIDADENVKEAVQENGLVRGHAYSITAIHIVETPRGSTPLLRIRNPWGNDQEWNGAWSDGSSEWQYIPHERRQKMQIEFKQDGEFWMEFDDFMREFEELETCNLGPDVMNEIAEMTGVNQESYWTEFQADGSWSCSTGTAGGCRNHMNTFVNNPQYGLSIHVLPGRVDGLDGKATIIVAVLQKYRRELRVTGLDSLTIGFSVYELAPGRRADRRYLESAHITAQNPVFTNTREVTARFRVCPGSYVIIPSTFEPDEEADFLLRIYSSDQFQAALIR